MVIDWSECDLVRVDPLRLGGRPTLRNFRLAVDDIVANYEDGLSVAEIAYQFEIKKQDIIDVLTYAERRNGLERPLG